MDKQEKQFVRIQSDETINVTMGLSYNDVTNPDAHIPDRLKVQPSWASTTVLIKKGTGFYPAYIAEWSTVQRLVQDKTFQRFHLFSQIEYHLASKGMCQSHFPLSHNRELFPTVLNCFECHLYGPFLFALFPAPVHCNHIE